MKHLTISILVLIMLSYSGCEDLDLPDHTPNCIKKRIRKFARSVSCDLGAEVESMYFQGQAVYIFNPGNCGADMSALVVDSDCNEICSLGGFTGNLVCNGDTLYKEATNKRVIWQN